MSVCVCRGWFPSNLVVRCPIYVVVLHAFQSPNTTQFKYADWVAEISVGRQAGQPRRQGHCFSPHSLGLGSSLIGFDHRLFCCTIIRPPLLLFRRLT